MKVLFFIDALTTGGAERQISVLAKGLSGRGHNVTVITLFSGGKIADELGQEERIELVSLWSKKSNTFIVRLFQLAAAPFFLRRLIGSTDYLYSMLESTNFIAWLATRYKKNVNLVWGVRSSNIEGHWKMALFDKFCAIISPSVRLVIANSHAGLEYLLKRGYRSQRYLVIPNGIDTEKFQYNDSAGSKLRDELGVSLNQPVVGIVARLNSMKGYPTFLKAAALVAKEVSGISFFCVGGGPDDYAEELYSLAQELGLKGRVIWLGDRGDMVAIYSALDILVSSSYGEGFSNVIGEAMSCGVPCVVTNVGDSAMIVGGESLVVAPKNPDLLANVICRVIENKKKFVKNDALRDRIVNKFAIENLVKLTEQEFLNMNVEKNENEFLS